MASHSQSLSSELLQKYVQQQLQTVKQAIKTANKSSVDETLRLFVAFSGGMDSAVLLDLLSVCQKELGCELTVLHFDHGLQSESAKWASFCQQRAIDYQLAFRSHTERVKVDPKLGLEASARNVRYQWLFSQVAESDNAILLTAHHADDQAETLLINLLRGTGVKGLRGIAAQKHIDQCCLLRPLLTFDREQLLAYAKQKSLRWIEDPSNDDPRFKRNALRRQVMPVLRDLQPGFARKVSQTATHMHATSLLLDELAQHDLQGVEQFGYCPLDASFGLALRDLQMLSDHRLLNVLQYWLQLVGYPPNSEQNLRQLLLWARQGTTANACLQNGARLYRYYRECLYVLPSQFVTPDKLSLRWHDAREVLTLDDWSLKLTCLQPEKYVQDIELRVELAGSKQRLPLSGKGSGHIEVRKRMQEAGVPPWRRSNALLVLNDDQLLAVVGGQQDSKRHPFVLQALN